MNVYIHTYVHIYTYLHLFLYICVCTDFNKSTNLYCSLWFVFIQQSDVSLKIPDGVSRNPSRATSALVSGLVSGNAFHRALVSTECEEKRWSHSGKGRSKASKLRGWWYHMCFSHVSLPWAESSHGLVSSLQESLSWSGLQWGRRFGNLTASLRMLCWKEVSQCPWGWKWGAEWPGSSLSWFSGTDWVEGKHL